MRSAAWTLLFIVLIYTAICGALFVFQRSFIYFPQPKALLGEVATLKLPIAEGELVVSIRPRTGPKALIYFGGNAEDVSISLRSFAESFPEHAIYLLHYRGYGGSSGKPTEALLHADAHLLFDRVAREHNEVAVIGRSLGSGVAIRLASVRPVVRLILITPYDSIESIAARQFPLLPVRWLLADKFESWRYATQIRVPTLLLAAQHDSVIPSASTVRLFASFTNGTASLVVIDGTDHNSISSAPQYLHVLRGAL